MIATRRPLLVLAQAALMLVVAAACGSPPTSAPPAQGSIGLAGDVGGRPRRPRRPASRRPHRVALRPGRVPDRSRDGQPDRRRRPPTPAPTPEPTAAPPVEAFPQTWAGIWTDPVTGGAGSLELVLTGARRRLRRVDHDGRHGVPGGRHPDRPLRRRARSCSRSASATSTWPSSARSATPACAGRSPRRARAMDGTWAGPAREPLTRSSLVDTRTARLLGCHHPVSTLTYRVLTSAGELSWRVDPVGPSAPWTSARRRSFGPSSRNTSRPPSRSAAWRSSSAMASACPARPSATSWPTSRWPGC